MSIKCGNPIHGKTDIRHESVSEVRACFAGQLTHDGIDTTPAETLAEINADQKTWPWSFRKGKDQHPFDLGRRVAEVSAEMGINRRADLENGPGWTGPVFMAPEPEERDPFAERMATDGQKSYAAALVAERDLTKLTDESVREITIRIDVQGTDSLTFHQAQLIIPVLKALPKAAKPAPEHKEQPWRTLSREVPAGNYKVTDEEGKNRFYRVSVGQEGYYKIQERASEELFFVPLKNYAPILRSILAVGVDAARLAYAQDQTRCWHCNTKLTDNVGNPHYIRGLGPKCGEEH